MIQFDSVNMFSDNLSQSGKKQLLLLWIYAYIKVIVSFLGFCGYETFYFIVRVRNVILEADTVLFNRNGGELGFSVRKLFNTVWVQEGFITSQKTDLLSLNLVWYKKHIFQQILFFCWKYT